LAPFALAGAELPKHPRELKFPARQYMPPKGAEFRHKLTNGATAFLVEDHDFPLINISMMIRTGQYLEPREKTGLASITGSQIRSGGTAKRSPIEFDEESAFLAAGISSGIGDVSGSAGLNCLAKDIDAGLALFVEMLTGPGFAEERLKLVKSQVLQAMQRRNDSTQEIEGREFARLMRGDHFSAWEETKANIEAITRQDLVDFHSRYYYPANFVFAVSGDFQTKQMLAKLESAFGGWANKNTSIPPVPKPPHKPVPGVYLVNKPEVNQGRVRMGHLGVTISNPDHLALSIMNGILGGDAFTSRITERVRSDEGLAYSASSSFPAGTYYEGVFSAGFQSKTATVAQAIDIVIEELNRMKTTKVSPEELQTAVNKAVEALPLRFATAAAKAGQFASDFYTNLPEDYWQQYTPRLRAVTADDIQRVAQKYLHPEQLVILAVGNVEGMLKGNPDRPAHSLEKIAGAKGITRIPLPDPLTMVYPAA
jgi:predicted Zn-dependent peptidase